MATLRDQLNNATLSNICKIDLMNHMEQIDMENSSLSKRSTTIEGTALPAAIFESTVSAQRKVDARYPDRGASVARYNAEKSMQAEAAQTLASSFANGTMGGTYTKSYKATYHDCPQDKNPFVESRNRAELSGRDQCFVRRYAEAATKTRILAVPKDDPASVAAQDAYKKAYLAYMGREPSPKAMEEVDRLKFSFDENGNVGVIQKPHSCFPHSHITNSNRHCEQCESQVYRPDVPAVRGARDRFPGPVPIWSSTKNLSAMVAGDVHKPGHHQSVSISKAATKTVVGPK